jgi:hypothetical protein
LIYVKSGGLTRHLLNPQKGQAPGKGAVAGIGSGLSDTYTTVAGPTEPDGGGTGGQSTAPTTTPPAGGGTPVNPADGDIDPDTGKPIYRT